MKVWPMVAGLMVVGILTGCAPTSNLVEEQWGSSKKLAVANQIANPDAEKNLEPVVGMYNTAADKTVTKYNKEFDKAAQTPVYSLGLTGMGTASTSSAGH